MKLQKLAYNNFMYRQEELWDTKEAILYESIREFIFIILWR